MDDTPFLLNYTEAQLAKKRKDMRSDEGIVKGRQWSVLQESKSEKTAMHNMATKAYDQLMKGQIRRELLVRSWM